METETENIVLTYLELMDHQREQLFAELEGLSDVEVWQVPGEKGWSIGENLDHLRVNNSRKLTLFKVTWMLLLPLAKVRYDLPYQVEIDNVYKRPGFPMNTSWAWSPKYTPSNPASLEVLEKNVTKSHQEIKKFFAGRDPDYLGHVSLFNPVLGWLNLIRALRILLYHDELHMKQIREVKLRLGNSSSIQAEPISN